MSSLSGNMRGILWMLLGVVGLSFIPLCIRNLAGHISLFEIMFLRGIIALVLIAPWFLRMRVSPLRTGKLRLLTLRAFFTLFAMFALYYGLSQLAMANAVALQFTMPLFSTLLAIAMLGERVDFRRWAATLIGFAGVLVILRPGIAVISLAALGVIGSAALFSAANICAKVLTRTERTDVILFYFYFLVPLFALGPTIYQWTTPSWPDWGWLFALAVANIVGQVAITRSFTHAELSVVMPFDFTRLILVAIIGFFVYAERPDLWVWLGAGIIFIGTYDLARRERGKSRKTESPGDPPVEPKAS